MNTILEQLKQQGADIEAALAHFCDDEDLYVTCVETIPTDENFPKLQAGLEQKDYDEAFMAAHTIKGVAGNLGLTKLFQTTSDLVEKLRGKTADDLAGQSFTEELDKIMGALREIEEILK